MKETDNSQSKLEEIFDDASFRETRRNEGFQRFMKPAQRVFWISLIVIFAWGFGISYMSSNGFKEPLLFTWAYLFGGFVYLVALYFLSMALAIIPFTNLSFQRRQLGSFVVLGLASSFVAILILGNLTYSLVMGTL